MKKLLALLIVLTVVLSPALALKGVGIKYGVEYTTVAEGKNSCITYGVYNPWDESVVAELTADEELEQFVKKIHSKKIPGGTNSGDAIQVKICFDVPKNTLDSCENTKVFEGNIIAREKKESSIGGVGSATTTIVTAPLTVEVVCGEKITGAAASLGGTIRNIGLFILLIGIVVALAYFVRSRKKKQVTEHPIDSHTIREIYMKKYGELMKIHARIVAGERNPELLRQYHSLRMYLEQLRSDM